MTSAESCVCGGAEYVSGEPCRCIEQRRVRQHIDQHADLAGAKPLKNDVPLDDVRLHGDWSLVRGQVAYHVARAFVVQRPLVTWLTSSSDVRSLYMSPRGELPRALDGKTFVVVRIANLRNPIVAAALYELATLTRGRAPVWLVTSPPEKPLKKDHHVWTTEFGAVLGDRFAMFDFADRAMPESERDALQLIGKGGTP
jgi:hypothetical protein